METGQRHISSYTHPTVSRSSSTTMPKRHKFCLADDCVSCFSRSFASIDKSRYWSENNHPITPRGVKKGNRMKYEFKCDVCFHLFSIRLDHVIYDGRFCPYCSGSTSRLCENDDCAHCFSRSFASVDKSRCWSENNHPTRPRDVLKWIEKKYEFKCDVCCHLFSSRLSDVTRGGFCPFCRGLARCKKADCTICFSRSLAASPRATYWNLSRNNGRPPRDVALCDNRKFWFTCDGCEHDFEISPNKIRAGRWCPYCSTPPRRLCIGENCTQCFNGSIAGMAAAPRYHPTKNPLPARQVFKNHNEKVWWFCPDCQRDYEASPDQVNKGGNCPFCRHSTESKLLSHLQSSEFTVRHQFRPGWQVVDSRVYDFLLEDHDIIIELDGDQHFRQVWNWKQPSEARAIDVLKMKAAADHGFSMIRILGPDVYGDRNNWQDRLRHAIRGLRKREQACVAFITNEHDIYRQHINDLHRADPDILMLANDSYGGKKRKRGE